MKSLSIFSVAILALTIGCDDAPAQNNGYGNHQVSQATPVQYQNENYGGNPNSAQQSGYAQTQNTGGDEITMHIVMNAQTGEPLLGIPVPISWKFIDGAAPGQPSATGPNGLTITTYPAQSFTYTNNPDMYQLMQQNGQIVVAPTGIENVMSQQIIPQFRQMGMTLSNQYPMPEVTANETAYYSKLNYSNPQNKTQSIGSEWTDREGNKAFVILQYREILGPYSMDWSYNVAMLKVSQAHFDKAKSQYIYSISNMVFNPKTIQDANNQMAAKAKADNDNYQKNRDITRKGQADRARINDETNAYIRNLNNEADAYRSHSNDIVQEQESNFLNDVNVVVSPYDGKEYQVESGSNTYWINNEGKYIQSDDPLYDPNKYEDYQGVWQKAPAKVYK